MRLEHSPPTTGSRDARRRRDSQQWALNWVIKQTGREQNFEYDGRRLPDTVKNYEMIPTEMLKVGMHREQIARSAELRGHRETACELFFRAVESYHVGQHAIFVDDEPNKAYLHERLTECFDKVRASADYRIERVEIPWGDRTIAGNLHIADTHGPAPAVVFLPGMDMVKESFPHPLHNVFRERGLHVLSIDGPGQGVSNLRKIRVTADNYERAAAAACHYLKGREEVDGDHIGAAGVSMGSYWVLRLAALEGGVKAVASAAACYGEKVQIFEESSPRFKQVFMYMAGLEDEDEFDLMAEEMTLKGVGEHVECPCLMVAGEYDPLSPLKDTMATFRDIAGPKELLVLENDFHGTGRGQGGLRNFGGLTPFPVLADWLRDVLSERVRPEGSRIRLVPEASGGGPYSAEVNDLSLRARFPPPVGH